MQLLAEAHNHEEGWFQKQMYALVLKAGSDQGSLGSRENARGQGGSHATCAEAWPSSSDEGGPSYGAREALVVQKGKSGTAGTRSTSLRGAGTSSTARKRSGPRVELAVRGLEDKGLGAGPDRRFKTPPGTGASKGKRKRVACLGNKGVTLPGIVSSPGPQVLDLGLAGDAEARMISAVVKGIQLALLPMTTLLSTKQAVEACKSSKSGTAGTRSTSLRGAGTSSTARKRSGPRVELAVRGLEDKGLGAGPDRRVKTPPGTGASKGKRKRVACLGNKGVTLPGIVSSPGPQVLELGLAGDAEARMISAVVKGVQLALLPMTTLLSNKQAVEAGKSSDRQGGSDSVLDGGSNRGTVGGELAQVSLGVESTAGCTLSTVPKVMQEALASATALPVQVAGQGADVTAVVSLLGEHPVVNSGAGQGTGLRRPLAGSKRLPDAAYGDSCTTILRSLGVHLSKEVKEKIWAGDYVEILSLLPGYNEAVAKSEKKGEAKKEDVEKRLFPRTFSNWSQAFGILAGVAGEKDPQLCSALFKYQDTIRKAFQKHGGMGWWAYDVEFRQSMEANKGVVTWNCKDVDLYLEHISGGGGSSFRGSNSLKGVWREHFQVRTSGRGRAGGKQSGVCWRYNESRCKFENCRFQHTCAGCGGQHPKSKCFKKDSKGFRGAGQQAVQEGGNASFSRGNGALAGKIPQ
ncbi:hypothetical protein FKM82_017498 [Ascaphus truei]